jgi:hypothetical protein
MDNLALITWTNTEYSDIWPAYFGQLEEMCPKYRSYIITNKRSSRVPKGHTQLVNKESDPFYKRMTDCLKRVKEDYVLYMQEDHIFYDSVDNEKITELLSFLKSSDHSSVRLVKSGELGGSRIADNIFLIPQNSQYLFSQQSAIWKKTDLEKILNYYKPQTYRDVEQGGSFACSVLRTTHCYVYRGEPQRGKYHFDSRTFPYIATAVCKGKWNISEYPQELPKILKKYKIDYKLRGVYGN